MFGPVQGFWDVLLGSVFLSGLIFISGVLIVFFLMLYLMIKDRRVLVGGCLLPIWMAIFAIAVTGTLISPTNIGNVRTGLTNQIESEYDMEVTSINRIEHEGGENLYSEDVEELYGSLTVNVVTKDNKRYAPEFRYSLESNGELTLYSSTPEAQLDPADFKK